MVKRNIHSRLFISLVVSLHPLLCKCIAVFANKKLAKIMTRFENCLAFLMFTGSSLWMMAFGQDNNSLDDVDAFNTLSFQTGLAHKETSTSQSEETDVDLLDSTYEPSESLPLPTILSTETFVSQETITEYSTVYIYPDATETATVTETDTSYYFTFRPGDVSIFTDALESQSTITLTAYVQDFVYSGVMVTPPAVYTTEHFTTTTTADQITRLQPSTVYTTVPTTLTETTTITETAQASDVLETVTSNYYITTTSTSAETHLQTDVMWVQTLLDETTTYVYTMRSPDRFQPYYLSTQVLYSTATITVLTTTTTTPPSPPVESTLPPEENNPQQQLQQQGQVSPSPSSSTTSSSSSGSLECFYFGGINARCILVY